MNQFDQLYSRRNTASVKWDLMENIYAIPDASKIIPMWVADMDFAAPSSVTEAIQKRLEFPLYGYTFENEDCSQAVTSWLKRRHDWAVNNEAVMYHQGVVPAISTIIEALSNDHDEILVNSPVYPPFFTIPKQLGRTVRYNPFIENKGVYTFNFEDFEQQLARPEVKIFILCHPHNPAGIVWSSEILQKIDELCFTHKVVIISDEIHSDLILGATKHIPLAKISQHPENIITCVAPTKTFNIAGVQAAMMICSDKKKRQLLKKTLAKHGQMGLNTFAIAAVQGAFSDQGEQWLNELIPYLQKNVDYVIDTITTAMPTIHIQKPDATYLVWLDIRETGYAEKEIMQKLLDAGVALDPGTKYGQAFEGFLRMNIACPHDTLVEAVSRFLAAFN